MVLEGKSIYGGIAIGKLRVYKKENRIIKRYEVTDEEAEIGRFLEAKERAKDQLKNLQEKAMEEIGEVHAAIFEVHQMMLEDEEYVGAVYEIIRSQKENAEYAVAMVSDKFSAMFEAFDDEYMRERASDVVDVSNRILDNLTGVRTTGKVQEEPVIILAKDLAPSETISLDKTKVLSFVTLHGSTNSHTAILARNMNIPALVGVEYEESIDGKMAIVDGYQGILIVEPTESELALYQQKREYEELQRRLLLDLKGKETITKDGRKINLYANIGKIDDVEEVIRQDAEGIGLLRSEFLYLEAENYPDEMQLFEAYKTIAENMEDKKVVIRTLDIGADKQVAYFDLPKEENPAMGYRAIRICLDREDVFKTQLRAIYRASFYGNISIMFPLITSVVEVQKVKAIIEEVKAELKAEKIPYRDCELGIMIETPAAAIISDLLAKEVDFFSIGTNDLTQYTLAVDRQNSKLDSFYDTHHEAILRMLRMVVDNAHKEGCWVGICGELASDLDLIETLVKMGIDELSVSSSMVLRVREKIRNCYLNE